MKIIIIFFALLSCTFYTYAQSDYIRVDNYVKKLGPLESLNVATIADTLSRSFSRKEDKARAFFYWIAHNIAMDGKSIRANDQKRSNPEQVIQSRKATALGYAKLFQEMCSMGNIRCLVVDGYVKNNAEDINNMPDEINHSWNVLQLGLSPEEWFYVDPARASGSLDAKQSVFTPKFVSGYFFADKSLFNLSNYPDNSAWQLGPGPKGMKEFYGLPVISPEAFDLEIKKPSPNTGFIKTKLKNSVLFTFQCRGIANIESVELVIGEGKRQLKPEAMRFVDSGGNVSFSYQFKKDDTYQVRILVDGKEALQYMVEVTE